MTDAMSKCNDKEGTTTLSVSSSTSTKQLDYVHEESMTEKEHKFKKDLLKIEKGLVGSLFGYKDSVPNNIAALLILIIILFLVVTSVSLFFLNSKEDILNVLEKTWNMACPIITLALGYLFGRKQQ